MRNWKEHVAIPVSDRNSLTPYVFYDYLLPALRSCLLKRQDALICLDMTQVESINPLVLPNLLVVGNILRKYYGGPTKLILSSQNLEVIRFLFCIGFFNLIDEHSFFSYDRDFVGGFSPKASGDIGVMRYVKVNTLTPEDISCQLIRSNSAFYAFIDHFNDEGLAEIFIRTVGELAHNCMKHGQSSAVICAYGGPKMGLLCSVSDCGLGYHSSLLNHPEDLLVFSEAELKVNDKYGNYKAIIEAVCRRFDKKTYGISSVIRDIAKIGGTTRIHSVDTQVVFTPRNQTLFKDCGDTVEVGHKLFNSLLRLAETSDSFQSAPVRIRESKLAGSHIEFEIPPLLNGTRQTHD